jgi:hypothetical protein
MATGPAYFMAGIELARNDDWIVSFQLSDGIDPIDLTDSKFLLQVRRLVTDHEAVIALSSDDDDFSIEITDAVNGMFQIWIAKEKLANVPLGDMVGDLIRILPDGLWERLWDIDPVRISQGTTRQGPDL